MNININTQLVVRLNPEGIEVFKRSFDEIIAKTTDPASKVCLLEAVKTQLKRINSNGCILMTLGEFMQVFGTSISFGKLPFDDDIRVVEKRQLFDGPMKK